MGCGKTHIGVKGIFNGCPLFFPAILNLIWLRLFKCISEENMRSSPKKWLLIGFIIFGLSYSIILFSEAAKTKSETPTSAVEPQSQSQPQSQAAVQTQPQFNSQAQVLPEPNSEDTQGTMIKTVASEHIFKNPGEMIWKSGPDAFPAGAQIVILEGDLHGVGSFTFRLKLPAGYKVPMYWSPSDTRLTVISGSVDLKVIPADGGAGSGGGKMNAGSFVLLPARMQTELTFTDETTVQMSGYGPWEVFYVYANEGPKKIDIGIKE